MTDKEIRRALCLVSWYLGIALLGFVISVLTGCGGGGFDDDKPEASTLPVTCSAGCSK